MGTKESQKAWRPLPDPAKSAPVQRPNTPVLPDALNHAPSPLVPSRASVIGSSHTTYVPPSPQCEKPPAYVPDSPNYRQPELVPEMPLAATQTDDSQWTEKRTPFDLDSHSWGQHTNGWDDTDWGGYQKHVADPATWAVTASSSTHKTFDPMEYLDVQKATSLVDIDGRDEFEEKNWWDARLSVRNERPGPGMLPTVLAEELHDPDHSLFSVSVTPPTDIRLPLPPENPSETPLASSPAPVRTAWGSQTPVPPTPPVASGPPHYPPSEDDVRTAVPHPNAYYCPRENGWVLLLWKSSSASLPLSRSFQCSDHLPLPNQARRRATHTCLAQGSANRTHHFHHYSRAINAHRLTPPFRVEDWEAFESVKQKRRGGTHALDVDVTQMSQDQIEAMGEELGNRTASEETVRENNMKMNEEEEEGKLLDLFVCCQCSFYCVASGVLPGVVPRRLFEEFVRDRRSHPDVGRSSEQSVASALELFLVILQNTLWKGERRLLRVLRDNFQKRILWSANVKKIFDTMGFVEEALDGEIALRPPSIDTTTAAGKMNRRKLLRAWVEFSAWVVDFKRVHVAHFRNQTKPQKLYVQLSSAREEYQTGIGAHPDQITRGELSDEVRPTMQFKLEEWKGLGLTPISYSPELLAFAYYAQCRCDPRSSHRYFSNFTSIVDTLSTVGLCPPLLQEVIATERSRDRFTVEDVMTAAATLGFGTDGPLKVEYDEADVEESFIENAWRECVKRSWRSSESGGELLRGANDALRILAEARGSESLRNVWENGKEKVMSPERAYDVLEVPKDVDDMMLITVFNMRMEESPQQQDRMREALQVIAEVRESERLRQFLELGRDPGDIMVPIRHDMPRGLNQLGNTCYLNSLLQYFYTIKDLREAVVPLSKLDLRTLENDKFSDDELSRHRVGGRLVTRREIVRSRKFVNQLADLFFNLEYCETAAVTPSIELAKLALVTSRDEEEDEADKGGTDSSNDTDVTLVEDAPLRSALNEAPASTSAETSTSPVRSPTNSVLGKRSRDVERQSSAMDIDPPPLQDSREPSGSPMREVSSSPPPLVSPGSPYATPPEPPDGLLKIDEDEDEDDVEMQATPSLSKNPPPLPPRKTSASESVMMFGKQHDVAECMDNCMFQIETALLKFDGSQGESSDKTSVVKRLFYGRLRQRLTGPQPSRSSAHEKEDLFSHLPVNVTNDGCDIYDGLGRYFDDIVEFQGERRRMEVTLVDLPPLLQIQLQRVQFNRETLQPYKSQAYVKFWETIYMDRFMDSAPPEKRARSKSIEAELNTNRDRLQLLLDVKDGSYTSSLDHSKAFVSKLGSVLNSDDLDLNAQCTLDDELITQLDTEQPLLQSEIDELRQRIEHFKMQLEAVWHDSTEMAYELTSVFVHRGSSPSWGHYFFYSRHLPDNPDSWFKYNDSDVSVVAKDEVLADTSGSTANPYLLVFARKGLEVVDTVKRFDSSQLE